MEMDSPRKNTARSSETGGHSEKPSAAGGVSSQVGQGEDEKISAPSRASRRHGSDSVQPLNTYPTSAAIAAANLRYSVESEPTSDSASVLSELPAGSLSTPSPFILGMHSQNSMDDMDLPEFVREHNATLTFPEKLMLMLTHVDKMQMEDPPISWILDGKAFAIYDRHKVADDILPLFLGKGKFTSFTRKLYRWGFRQISVPSARPSQPPNPNHMHFGHYYFQRDNKQLMVKMRSTTAAGRKRAAQRAQQQETNTAALGTERSRAAATAVAVDAGGRGSPPNLESTSAASSTMSSGAKRPASQDLDKEASNELRRRALFASNQALTQDIPNATRLVQPSRQLQGPQVHQSPFLYDPSTAPGGLTTAQARQQLHLLQSQQQQILMQNPSLAQQVGVFPPAVPGFLPPTAIPQLHEGHPNLLLIPQQHQQQAMQQWIQLQQQQQLLLQQQQQQSQPLSNMEQHRMFQQQGRSLPSIEQQRMLQQHPEPSPMRNEPSKPNVVQDAERQQQVAHRQQHPMGHPPDQQPPMQQMAMQQQAFTGVGATENLQQQHLEWMAQTGESASENVSTHPTATPNIASQGPTPTGDVGEDATEQLQGGNVYR